jgi:hypothetical protein
MGSPYRFVNVGSIDAIMGADPDVAMLMRGGRGVYGGDELDQLGGSSGYNLSIGADGSIVNSPPQNSAPNLQQLVNDAVAMRMAQQGAVIRQQAPLVSRDYPIGFDSGTPIDAGGTLSITVQPQVLFRAERFVVPSDIAGQFLINDIKVGKDSMLAAAGSLPARAFDERAVGVRMMLATSQVSQQIIVSVTNIGGAPQRFNAVIFGKAIEQG